MPRVGLGHRLATLIYRHGASIRVVAKVGRRAKERRFPIGTDLAEMQRWQLHTKADLLQTEPRRATSRSIEADVPTYLATLAGTYR